MANNSPNLRAGIRNTVPRTGSHTAPAAATARSPVFGMLYVLGIFMIMDGHVGSFDYLDLHGLLRYQNYHVALFMFVSGYFLNLSRGYGTFFRRKFMRLIVPLYAWNAAYGLLCWYLNRRHGFSLGGDLSAYNLLIAPLTDGHRFIYNMAGWFLVPLFFVQAAGFVILKPFAEKADARGQTAALLFFAAACALGASALSCAPENHGEPGAALAALRTLYFLPPFAFGFLYRRLLEKYDTLPAVYALPLLLLAVTILTTAFPGINHIPSWLNTVNAPAAAIYALSLLAILFWLRVARVLAPLWQKNAALQYISAHTFDLMMHHFAGFMIAKALFLPLAPDSSAATRVKSDIWYYPFPAGNENFAWTYLAISLVIALLTGFTFRKIYAKISEKLSWN